jgi:CheY-like chemotaxis protein
MNWEIPHQIALEMIKGLSGGFAIFEPSDHRLLWCNPIFRKQTWFGNAVGGKNATEIRYLNLFLDEDQQTASDLFDISVNMGTAYDFQRSLRRGPTSHFPAELKFRSVKTAESKTLVVLEIKDLSIHKQFEDLEQKHHTMKDQFSSVMAEQADLHYTVRLGTLSELGADMAHSLINPVTMCRDILEREIVPLLQQSEPSPELQKVFNYLKGIEDLALWFRKFSDPKLAEAQVTSLQDLVQDAIILNMSKLTKYGMSYHIQKFSSSRVLIFGMPFHIMSWIGACIGEILLVCRNDQGPLCFVTRMLNADRAVVIFKSPIDEKRRADFNPKTMEMQTNRLPASASWKWAISRQEIEISLEFDAKEQVGGLEVQQTQGKNAIDAAAENKKQASLNLTASDIPCMLIVDDEEDIRRLVRRSLSVFNAEIWEAENGLKALDLLQKKALSGDLDRLLAIVSDVRMPDMNGIQLLKAIKSKKMDCPFVFLSSNLVDPAEAGNFGEEHGVYYLTKESKLEKLKELLDTKLSIPKHSA